MMIPMRQILMRWKSFSTNLLAQYSVSSYIQIGVSGVIGLILGFGLGSIHKPVRHSRKMVEHCVLVGTGLDYHDVECPSGTWRYYGDTLHVRLHT